MTDLDLNLLTALDTLLAEANVTRAARTLGLSASAMSRTLARLRDATGDALLVRAGRDMVLTPHAHAIRARTRDALREARALLAPPEDALDLPNLARTFTIRANEAFAEVLGAALIADFTAAAPSVRLHFMSHAQKDTAYLRSGAADLEIGVVEAMGPEVRTRALFRDRYLGVVHGGHALAAQSQVSAQAYAAFGHVATPYGSGIEEGIDAALALQGLARITVVRVPTFAAALAVARGSDLVALLPASFMLAQAASSLHAFELPVPAEGFTIAQMWHPRLEADAAHRWLRERVLAVCRARLPL